MRSYDSGTYYNHEEVSLAQMSSESYIIYRIYPKKNLTFIIEQPIHYPESHILQLRCLSRLREIWSICR